MAFAMSSRSSSKPTTKKRLRDSSPPPTSKPGAKLVFDGVVLPYPKNRNAVPTTSSGSYTDAEAYAPSRFGEMGDYMRRKRLKLQVQNEEVASQQDGKPQIFKNIRIYVRGLCLPLTGFN